MQAYQKLLGELEGLKRGTSKLLGPSGFLGNRGVMVIFGLLAVALAGTGAWMLLNPVAEPPVQNDARPTPVEGPATSNSGAACSNISRARLIFSADALS